MPSLKTDESFLKNISIGAIGTRRVFEDLARSGHHPIELERGSRTFKIWTDIKIKRIRVPDILCVRCALRVESRGKTKFEVSMSHSLADAERSWNSGLYDEDYVGLVGVSKNGARSTDWIADKYVTYINIGDLKVAVDSNYVTATTPKGAQEGFEKRLIWPSTIAGYEGEIVVVEKNKIKVKRKLDNRLITYTLRNKGVEPRVRVGEVVHVNQILASVVHPYDSFPCKRIRATEHFIQRLGSTSISERYAAAKALRFMPQSKEIIEALDRHMSDADEHIYVRMEAAATLASSNLEVGWEFIEKRLEDDFPANRLEAVIMLAEMDPKRAVGLLESVLSNTSQHPEVRAGAAWSLGELRDSGSIEALIHVFTDIEDTVKIEAARSLARFAPSHSKELISRFGSALPQTRPGIAWALSQKGTFEPIDLLNASSDEDAKIWASYILGMRNSGEFVEKLEELRQKDEKIYFATTVLWKIVASWVYEMEAYE